MPTCPSCGQPLPEGSRQCPRCSAQTGDLRTPFPPIKGYEVVKPLGEGGMGAVYLATDQMLHRRVAVKVVSRRIVDEPEAMSRFLREARSMAQIEHPHIVRVYSFGDAEGQPYLVMEYVEGVDLATRIAREGPLPVPEALRITRQAAEALEAAWEQQVVHRDIKPSNLLLDKRNQVRVGDFGLAKPVRADAGTPLTQSSYVLGTPHYASPEQVRGHTLDFRTDIYSLGIVLYEMLTGERPFEGTTPFDIMTRQVSDPLPFLQEKRRDVPEAVARLVAWMTQKDPARRPESYRQLIESLETVLEQGTVRMTPEAFTPVDADATIPLTPADVARAITPQPVPARKQRWLYYGAPAAALVLVLGGWLAWTQFGKAPPARTVTKRLVVAVTPFYGPDEDSLKEGRVMAALVERAVVQRLKKFDVKVMGVEETKEPVRGHEAARELGEKLGATVVVWGEAFVLRGETEIQPYFTLIPTRQTEEEPSETVQRAKLGDDPLAALQQRSAGAMKVGAAAPNQIEVRKTSAAGVGDMVMLLAGFHALYTEKNPDHALAFFRETPETAESLRYQAEAFLQQEKTDYARAAIREAVRLDPRSASAQAFLGDLLMEEGKMAEAAAAYRTAADVGESYDSRGGIWYLGKLYLAETAEALGEKKPVPTGYLLGMDPKSGKVLERFRLPDNPVGFSSDADGFRIRYEVREHPPAEIGFALGEFDRPVFYSDNLLRRRMSTRAGEAVGLGFVGSPEQRFEIKPAIEKVDPDPKAKIKTVEELEAELRRRMEKDLTQPWDLFWLGHALWAQGRRAEAEGTWAALFSIGFPGTPYFEFAQMAYHFERFSQPQWADRAFEEALNRRKKMPQPVGDCYLIGRVVTANVVSLAARRSVSGLELERNYLWLQRARELTGPSLEVEDLAATAWERYFREKGQTDLADQEAAVARGTRGHPGNFMAGAVRLDLGLYAVGSLGLGLLLLVAFLAARAAARCERHPLGGLWLKVARGAGAVLVFAIGGFFVTIAVIAMMEGDEWIPVVTVAAFGLVVMLSVLFRRRLGLSVPALLVGAVAGVLFLFGVFGLALAEGNKEIPAALIAWGLGLAMVMTYRFRARLGLSWAGIPRRRELVAAVTFHERLVLVAAVLAAQVAVGYAVSVTRTILAVATLPVGIMDAMGSDAFVADMEDKLKGLDTPERRYVAAVSNHLAGHRDRARELYESLPDDTRAQQNLSALNSGELVPPVALTSADVLRALDERTWKDSLKDWFSPGSISDLLLLTDAPTPSSGPTRFFYWAFIVLFAACLAHFVFIRPQASSATSDPTASPNKRWLYRAGFSLFPGLYDLRFGSLVRGYVVAVLAGFLFLVGLVHLRLEGSLAAMPGIISAIAVPNLASTFPLPTPPGVAENIDAAWAYHFWTLFWAYPYAKLFWPFVGLSALGVLAYHATRLRKIWQL